MHAQSGILPPKPHKRFRKSTERAARFVTNNYNMETRESEFNLNELDWPILEERRQQNNFSFLKSSCRFSWHSNWSFNSQTDKPHSKINAYTHSFYPQSCALWNKILPDVRLSTDFYFFSSETRKIDLTSVRNTISWANVIKA